MYIEAQGQRLGQILKPQTHLQLYIKSEFYLDICTGSSLIVPK